MHALVASETTSAKTVTFICRDEAQLGRLIPKLSLDGADTGQENGEAMASAGVASGGRLGRL